MERDYKLIYIDDEPNNLKTFSMTFEDDFEIFTFLSAKEALSFLEQEGEFPVIISDQRMPVMTGTEFFAEVIKIYPDTVRILLSAFTDTDYLMSAINKGKVYSYITKPFLRDDTKNIIDKAFEKYYLIKENQKLIKDLSDSLDELKAMQDKLINQERRAVVGTLTTGISHEIKSQLTPVDIFLNELKREHLSDEGTKIIYMLSDIKDRIVNLVEEISALAKNEQTEYNFVSQQLKDIIKEAVYLAKLDKDVINTKILMDFQNDVDVYVDKNKIIQVMLNLLRNASQAISDKSQGEIVIKTELVNTKVCVSVSDNGHGIDKEKHLKIWEPFFSTKGNEGTGIGLDVCKRIIEGHDGSISVESKVNKGTCFRFELPIKN